MLASSFDLLSQRIDVLERTYIGLIDKNQDNYQNTNIAELLNDTNNKYDILETKIPNIKNTYELISKLRPIMMDRRDNLTKILQKIELIILNKEMLQQNIKSLSNMKELTYVIDSDCYKDTESLKDRLDSLEEVLNFLTKESDSQSIEIDELLNIYEKAMKIISDACVNWEDQLKPVQR